MGLPWNPEKITVLRARYAAAVTDLYDHGAIAAGVQPRPGTRRRHVFDWPDGLRLIVSRDRLMDGRIGICVSGSVQGNTRLSRWLQTPDPATALASLVCQRWQHLARSDRIPQLVGWSSGKGVPHFVVWDARAADTELTPQPSPLKGPL